MAACFRYIVDDVDAAIQFYTGLLGFRLEMHPAPPFAEISRGDTHVYLTQPGGPRGGGAPTSSGQQQTPGGWNRVHLLVDELDGLVARLRSAGASFRSEVIQGVGGQQILLEDPSGNLVELFEPNTAAYRAPGSGSLRLKSVVPILFVSDVPATAAFFRDKLGFEIDFLHGEPPFYGAVCRDEVSIHLRFVHGRNFPALAAKEESLILASVEVSNVEALYEEFRARGVEFAQPLTKQVWGGTDFQIRDPDGNAFSFVTYGR